MLDGGFGGEENAMRVGLYPGTFDPVTNGHLDIIGRAMKLVDRLVIGVAQNDSKGPLFSTAERVAMVEAEVAILGKDIVVQPFSTLLMHFAESLGASVIVWFEGTIQQIVALAVLMPIVSAIGGNAGTQALTVTVRALATRELNSSNAPRTFWRELVVGLSNGLILAPLIGLATAFWFRDENWLIGVVIAVAMVLNLLVAASIGVLTPLTLSKLKFDPAVSSAVFVTATTDFFGFLIFLGLATMVLL